jgi:hypothetical protein
MICAVIALAVVGFPSALLIQRRLRQAKAAARLRIAEYLSSRLRKHRIFHQMTPNAPEGVCSGSLIY